MLLEGITGDLPDGRRRILIGTHETINHTSKQVAHIDLFGELAELARTSPTFERDLRVFLMLEMKKARE